MYFLFSNLCAVPHRWVFLPCGINCFVVVPFCFVIFVLLNRKKRSVTLNHDLLLAKLNAYEFSKDSLTLIRRYLKNR